MIRAGTRLGHFLFPDLGCAVPVVPGGIIFVFWAKLHRDTPIFIEPEDLSDIPSPFQQETRLQVIAYRSGPALDSRLERCLPTTRLQHDRRHPTHYDLITHGLAVFGSGDGRKQ